MCLKVVSSYSTSDVCPIFQTICYKLVVMSAAAPLRLELLVRVAKKLVFTIYWFCKVRSV